MASDTTSCAVLISIPSLPMSKVTTLSSIQALMTFQEFRSIHHIQSIPCRLTMDEFFNVFLLPRRTSHHPPIHLPKVTQDQWVVERFNRTLQEEFINRNDEIYVDLDAFAEKLTGVLRWYNGVRIWRSTTSRHCNLYKHIFRKVRAYSIFLHDFDYKWYSRKYHNKTALSP